MTGARLLALSLLALPACAVDPNGERVARAGSPIQGGAEDAATNAVVAIVNTQLSELCTGARIAPNLVLTAAHCLSTTPTTGQTCEDFLFGGLVDPSEILFTDETTIPAMGFLPVTQALTPAVAGESMCDRDLALVILASPVDATAAPPLVPRLDDVIGVGEVFSAVGYGQVGDGAGIGTRRRLDGLGAWCVGDCGEPFVGPLEWIGHPAMAHTGGRPGDSGSPAIDASGEIAGVFVRHLEYPASSASPDELVYGAIAPHRDFLRDGALRAAEIGGYDAPSWADDDGTDPPPGIDPEGGGCTISAVTRAGGRSPWLAALAVAGLVVCAARRARLRSSKRTPRRARRWQPRPAGLLT